MSDSSPTSVPKSTAIDAEIVKEYPAQEEKPTEEAQVDPGPRPDGWEGVVWDCERALGCPDRCKSPEDSNLVNIINDLIVRQKNLANDIINIAKMYI